MPQGTYRQILGTKGLQPFLWTQFLGAFNENADAGDLLDRRTLLRMAAEPLNGEGLMIPRWAYLLVIVALVAGGIMAALGETDSQVDLSGSLAAVLGHEVAHVDLRHCIEQYQYRVGLERAGVTALPAELIVDAGRWLITAAYSQGQELEADAQGLRMAVQAGYDPAAGAAVFARLAVADGEKPRARERTPVGEVTVALGGIVSAYFRSHPRSLEASHASSVS